MLSLNVDPADISEVDWNLPDVEPLQLAVGGGIAVVAVLLARLLGTGVRGFLRWRGRSPNYAQVFGTLSALVLGIVGVGIGLAVAFPSVEPVDVLGGLGIISIAVGIAFQDVLGNLFAGVLILVREPFSERDQIAVGDVRGTVERVTLRETVVKTFDGRRVLIPNSTVHGGVLTVQTGYGAVRTSLMVGVAYDTDLALARRVAVEAMSGLPGVLDEPAPQALVRELGASTIDIELRFWSGARQLETREAQDAVIEAVVTAYAAAGVEMPAEVRVLESGPSFRAALAEAAGVRVQPGEKGTAP
ncbi:MAG: mechanosensitive ion channel family protein [Actinomycetes bacterium]|nr:mechanosensitive ion channel family protein [Actinomycetes bacterium]